MVNVRIKYKPAVIIASIGAILVLPITAYLILPFPKQFINPGIIEESLTKKSVLTENQLQTKARNISVKVLSGDNKGSGILIREENGVYTVLTNQHVIENGASHQIQTPDGKIHQAKIVPGINFGNNDMALLQFNASEDYAVASLENLKTV
ncbi:MAG: trypsin-like peptidase domain-containing protein, partial [Okeania sp. SIO3C4]|nr:trypsin-like peptidase domain-containing protein [Okeania sp. SIO3C4]